MEVLYPHCAGLDVHKNSVVACARHMSGGKVLANAAHVKNVPGRKTDVNDAQWLADLMAHGLIRASFVPDQLTQQIRDLLRTRKQLVRERTSHTLRIQKVLEDANIKLDSVVTDLLGLSGRRILDALVNGQTTPAVLAALADGRIRATTEELTAALYGRVTFHHRVLVKLHRDQIDAIAQAIAAIDEEVDSQAEPFRQPAQMLSTIPGLGPLAALVVLAEIGLGMSHFPSATHLISWAGLCPRNDESAGKRRSTRMRTGAPWLKTVLVQCAWAAARTKGSYFQSLYHRLRSRRGAKQAIGAVAASLLTTIYHMLKNGTLYEDLGANYFDQKSKERQAMRLINRLHTLGYQVHIEQKT